MTKHFSPGHSSEEHRDLGSALGRARSALRSSSGLIPATQATRRRRLAFDPLEKRFLLSADISPYLDALDDGLDRLEALVDDLQQFEEMAADIPVLGESLGDAADLSGTLRSELIDPIQAFLNTVGTADLDALVNEINGLANATATIVSDTASEFSVGVSFQTDITLADQLIDLGAQAAALGIEFDADFDFSTTISFDFSFGMLLDPALAPTDAFFIGSDASLSAVGSADLAAAIGAAIDGNNDGTVDADSDGIQIGMLGKASLDATSSFGLNAKLDVTLTGAATSDLKVTAAEIDAGGVGLLSVDADLGATGLNGTLKIDFDGAAQGINLLTLDDAGITVSLTGDFFDNPGITVSIDTPDLADFTRLTPTTLLSFLGDLGAKLETLATGFNDIAEIDFLDVGIGELADFNDAARDLIAGLSVPALLGAAGIDYDALTGNGGAISNLTIELTLNDPNDATAVSTESFVLGLDLDALGTAAGADGVDGIVAAINAALAANADPFATRVQAFAEQGQIGFRTVNDPGATAVVTDIALRSVASAITDAFGLQTDQTGLPLPTFETAQEFAAQLASLPVFDALGADLAYDTATRSLTFTMDILNQTVGKSVDLSFTKGIPLTLPGNISLGELSLTGSAVATIDADVHFSFGAGLDLTALDTTTLLTALNGGTGVGLEPGGGDDLLFQFRDGSSAPVSLSGATTIQDVIDAIATQTFGKAIVTLDPIGSTLIFTENETLVTLVLDDPNTPEPNDPILFGVAGTATSTAIFDLGFGFGVVAKDAGKVISGASIIDRFFIDAASTDIGAAVTVQASDINLYGSIGFLTFGVQHGQLGGTLVNPAGSPGFFDDFIAARGSDQLDDLSFALQLQLSDLAGDPGDPPAGRIYLTELTEPGAGGDFGVVSLIDFVGTTIQGELVLPLVFDDAGVLGLDADPIFLSVGFKQGSILPDIQIPDTDQLDQLFEILKNLGTQDLLTLVTQIGSLIADQVEFMNIDLPLLDASLGDLVQFVQGEFSSIVEAFNAAIVDGLGTAVDAFEGELNALLNAATTPFNAAQLQNLVNAPEFQTILDALQEIKGQITDLPSDFDLLFSDVPGRLLSAFAAIKGAFAQLVDTGRSSLKNLGDFAAIKAELENALQDKLAEIAEIVPSTETVLRLIQQALGFDLPSLDENLAADLMLGVFAKVDQLSQLVLEAIDDNIANAMETARTTMDSALGDFETFVNGLKSYDVSLNPDGLLPAELTNLQLIDFDAILDQIGELRDLLQSTDPDGVAGLIDNIQAILGGGPGALADLLDDFQSVIGKLKAQLDVLQGDLLKRLNDFVDEASDASRSALGFAESVVADMLGQFDELVNAVLNNASLRNLVGTAATVLDTAQDTALTALGDFETAIAGVAGVQPILDKIAELQALLDGTQTEVAVQDLIDQLNAIASGTDDIFALIAMAPDIADVAGQLIDCIESLLAEDFSQIVTDLGQGVVDDLVAALRALADGVIDQVRGAILGFFGGGILSLDINNTGVDVGLSLAPTIFSVDTTDAGFDFSFGVGDLFSAGIEDAGFLFQLGGVIDIGLRLVFADGDGGFGSDFDLLFAEDSRIELTALMEITGSLAIDVGSVGIVFGPAVMGDPIIELTNAAGDGPATLGVVVTGTATNGYIALGDLGLGVAASLALRGEAVAFADDGTTPIEWDGVQDGTIDPPIEQVAIGFDATISVSGSKFEPTFTGNPLDQEELQAIFDSLIGFNFENLLDAFLTLIEFLENALGADGLGGAPLIGDELTSVSLFLKDFRTAVEEFIEQLKTIGDADVVKDMVQDFLFQKLAEPGLGILLDSNGDVITAATKDQIVVSFYDTSDNSDVSGLLDVDSNTALVLEPLTIGLSFSDEVDFDFGLDALIFEVESSGGVEVSADLAVTIGFGLSVKEGAFLVFADADNDLIADPVLTGGFNVRVKDGTEPGENPSTLGFRLFFLGIEATPWIDDPDTPEDEGLTFDDRLNGTALDPRGEGVGFNAALSLGFAKDDGSAFTTGNASLGGGVIATVGDLGTVKFDPSLTFDINIDLNIVAGIASGTSVNENFPTLTTYLNIDWAWNPLNGDDAASTPTVGFYDLRLDMGEFIENALGNLLDSIETFVAPLQPFLDFLDLEIPIISQLSELFGQGTVTFLDAIKFLGSGFDSVAIFLDVLDTVNTVLGLVDQFAAGTFINFGDLEITNSPGIDLRDIANRDTVGGTDLFSQSSNVGATSEQDLQNELDSKEGGALSSLLQTLKDVGLSLPFLEDPSQIFGLLFGQRIDFVVWDIPRLSAEFGVSYKFGPILPPVPLFVTVGGGFEIFLDLAVGYDSRGLETGDFFDGFYFRDFDEDGNDQLELGLSVFFEATASLSVVVAEAGVTGGVAAEIGANWHDPNNDGKFYLDELAERFRMGVLCIFDLEGALTAYLEAFVKLGFDTPFGFVTLFEDTFELLRVTLLDFSITCEPLPPPEIATVVSGLGQDANDDVLRLNIGAFAAERQPGATDGEDKVDMFGDRAAADPADDISLWEAGGLAGARSAGYFDDGKITHTEAAAALAAGYLNKNLDLNSDGDIDDDEIRRVTDLDGTLGNNAQGFALLIGYGEWEVFDDADVIYGDAGAEDDEIIGDNSLNVRVHVIGGAGDDNLVGGKRNDILLGGGGADDVLGLDGNDLLAGDGTASASATGGLTVTDAGAGTGVDAVFGGAGGDTLYGGGDNDQLFGATDSDATGDLADTLYGGSGEDAIKGALGDDVAFGGQGADNIDGEDGDDELHGGSETDLIQGGLGADLIFGDSGDDIIFGEEDGFTSLPVGVQVADLGDTIYGGSGDDDIRGQFGNDRIEGGTENDRLIGGAGQDIIKGDGGIDEIHGDRLPADGLAAATDVEHGIPGGAANQLGADTLYGGAAGDVIFGGEGRDFIIGGVTNIADYFGSSLMTAADGGDLIRGGTGDDVILGDDGTISGVTAYSTNTTSSTLGGVSYDDRIFADEGSDQVAGGHGADAIFGDKAGGAGEDILIGDQVVRNGNTITASHDDDDGNDAILGYGASDLIIGGGGADGGFGSLGDDLVVGDYATVILNGLTGTLFQQIGRVTSIDTDKGGNDRLLGEAGSDIIVGGFGADVISGGGIGDQADIILGDHGVVVFNVGTGDLNDIYSLDGQIGGNDLITGGDGDDLIIAGAGDDDVFGQADNDVILGDAGAIIRDDVTAAVQRVVTTFSGNAVTGVQLGGSAVDPQGTGDDDLDGGTGSDIIAGGLGSDIVFGRAGDDVMLGDNGEVLYNGTGSGLANVTEVTTQGTNGANDALLGEGGQDIGFGGAGDDQLWGDLTATITRGAGLTAGTFTSPGGGGRDVLAGDHGRVLLIGGAPAFLETLNNGFGGNDLVVGHDGGDVVVGGFGQDVVHGDAPTVDIAKVTVGDDVMLGDSGSVNWNDTNQDNDQATIDVIDATVTIGADDLLFGNGGNDVGFGGAGSDLIYGDFSADVSLVTFVLSNRAGSGQGGNDVLVGDLGVLKRVNDLNDELTGLGVVGAADWIEGHDGIDALIGGADRDALIGDAQSSDFTNALILSANTGDDALIGDSGLIQWRLEAIPNSATIDRIRSADDDTGVNGGDDVLLANDGRDIGIGGQGSDLVLGDFRYDVTDNGAAFVLSNAQAAAAKAGIGADDILAGDGAELLQVGGEPVWFASRNIGTGAGNGGMDLVEGHDGADALIGGAASDIMIGDAMTKDVGLLNTVGADVILGDAGEIDWAFGPDNGTGQFDTSVGDGDQTTIDLIRSLGPDVGAMDVILGNDGRDILIGGFGGDLIYGDRSADVALGTLVVSNEVAGGVVGAVDQDWILGDNGEVWFTIQSDSIGGRPDLDPSGTLNAVFLVPTVRVMSTDPTHGGNDLILGDGASDLIIGGTGADRIWGDDGVTSGAADDGVDGDDLIFGDHGKVWITPTLTRSSPFGDDYFAIDTGALDGGAGDLVFGEAGDDIALGQQGDDVIFGGLGQDDLIGGHNVEGGSDDLDGMNAAQVAAIGGTLAEHDPTDLQEVNDVIDGDEGEDVIAGDNAIIKRENVNTNPRYRALTGTELYSMVTADVPIPGLDTTTFTVDLGFVPNVGAALADPTAILPRSVFLLDFDKATEDAAAANPGAARPFGDDIIAGGQDSDHVFGQLGDDIVEGDGSIDIVAADAVGAFDPATTADPSFVIPDGFAPFEPVVSNMLIRPEPILLSGLNAIRFSVFSTSADGDDYVEGNGGNDRIYGNLGQDDLIGGSSSLFSIFSSGTGAELRPDGADLIYGNSGAPEWLERLSDHTTAGDPDIDDDNFHVADADFIAGDNANIYRLDGLAFTYAVGAGYGSAIGTGLDRDLEIRVIELLDYSYTIDGSGIDPDTGTVDWKTHFNDFGTGLGDLIHGESGDDVIHGMTGDDLIFGESGDDDIYGQAGADIVFGGNGEDGILGDDGLLKTSRNGETEVLNGLTTAVQQEIIRTPGNLQLAVINRTGELNKAVDMIAFDLDGAKDTDMTSANDIIFGGLGDDWIHSGDGSDAVSGAEALPEYYMGGTDVNAFLKAQQDFDGNAAVAADPFWIDLGLYNPGNILRFGALDPEEFALYDEDLPRQKIMVTANGETRDFILNFLQEGPDDETFSYNPNRPDNLKTDGQDNLFGDLGEDWIVGGTGRDHMFGGRGNDLLNMDDDLDTDGGSNLRPDSYQEYADIAYDGAGRDVVILNTGADRAIAWVGEYNSYIVPFSPYGAFQISRTLQPQTEQFVLDLARANGADETTPDILRFAEQFAIDDKLDNPLDPAIYEGGGSVGQAGRFGSPFNELGMVRQEDFDWQDQTGSPDDPQAGNEKGGRNIMRRELWLPGDTNGQQKAQLEAMAEADQYLVDQMFDELYGTGETTSSYNGVMKVGDEIRLLAGAGEDYLETVDITSKMEIEKAGKNDPQNALVLFDYYADDFYRYVRFDAENRTIEIGHVDAGGAHVDANVSNNLRTGREYEIAVYLNGSTITVHLDGDEVLSHLSGDIVTDGAVGFGTDGAKANFVGATVVQKEPRASVTYGTIEDEWPYAGIDPTDVDDEVDWDGTSSNGGSSDGGSGMAIFDPETDSDVTTSSTMSTNEIMATDETVADDGAATMATWEPVAEEIVATGDAEIASDEDASTMVVWEAVEVVSQDTQAAGDTVPPAEANGPSENAENGLEVARAHANERAAVHAMAAASVVAWDEAVSSDAAIDDDEEVVVETWLPRDDFGSAA